MKIIEQERAEFYREFEKARSRNDFENWVFRILKGLYPKAHRLHQSNGDGGVDVFVPGRRAVYQCYGPEYLKDWKAARKIPVDFRKVLKTLPSPPAEWYFVHNHPSGELSKHSLRALERLRARHRGVRLEFLGIHRLWEHLKELPARRRRKILGATRGWLEKELARGIERERARIKRDFDDIDEATPYIKREVARSLTTRTATEILIVGGALVQYWNRLEAVLDRSWKPGRTLTLKLVMMDMRDSRTLRLKPPWLEGCKNVEKRLAGFIKRHHGRPLHIRRRFDTARLTRRAPLFGVVIDGHTLFKDISYAKCPAGTPESEQRQQMESMAGGPYKRYDKGAAIQPFFAAYRRGKPYPGLDLSKRTTEAEAHALGRRMLARYRGLRVNEGDKAFRISPPDAPSRAQPYRLRRRATRPV